LVARAVDRQAHRVADHLFGRVWPQHLSDKIELARVGFEPQLIVLRVQDDGHAVVHGPQQLVGLRRQDGAEVDGLALPLPPLPQPGEAERPPVPHPEEVGLLSVFPPLVE
jgi:hypothetical protein